MFDRRIDWFYVESDRYTDLEPGNCRSRVFPGLWLDGEAVV
ncbi:MAG: hypothetical protein AAFW95_14585 [Cyanobacteria bacterium J06638_6]